MLRAVLNLIMAIGTQSKPLTKFKFLTVFIQPAFFYGAMNLTYALILPHDTSCLLATVSTH